MFLHYDDVIMRATASQVTSLTIVCSTVYLDTNHKKHQSSASLAFVRGIHRKLPVNSPHKWPVTRKMFPFDDVIMIPLTVKMVKDITVLRKGRISSFQWELIPRNIIDRHTRLLTTIFDIKGSRVNVLKYLLEHVWSRSGTKYESDI